MYQALLNTQLEQGNQARLTHTKPDRKHKAAKPAWHGVNHDSGTRTGGVFCASWE